MPERIKKNKNPVSALISESSPFHVEIDKSGKGVRLIVSGVKRITELSENCIFLKCQALSLKLSGDDLSLALYEDKSLEISGKVEVIELANTKN